jgi:amino acid efflux transporter
MRLDRVNEPEKLSISTGAALTIGAVLGTGVIALPALGAQIAGPASLLAWLALIVLSIPLATTFAALGARYPSAGGVSTYVRAAFGPRMATVAGWTFYFAVPVGAPAAGMFAGAYVAAATGGGERVTWITAVALIVVMAAANAAGLRVSGRVQLGIAAVLALLLVTATVTALPHAKLANLEPFAPNGWQAIGPAAAVLVWGFAGWEAVTSLAADYRRPARDLPRVTWIAIAVVSVLYFTVAATSILVLGPAAPHSPAPLGDLLATGVGGEARVITAVAAVLLTAGAMNAYFAGAAKLGAALSRDGALPGWLAVTGRDGVPRRSLGLFTGLGLVAAVGFGLAGTGARPSAQLATSAFILIYVLCMAAAIKLLPRASWPRRVATVAFVAVVVLLVQAGWYIFWALAVAVAAILYDKQRDRAVRTLRGLSAAGQCQTGATVR